MKTSGRIAAVVVATGVVMSVAGCAASTPAEESEVSVLTIARAADVTTLNADAVASSREGWETLLLLADSLFAIGPEGIEPRIADSFEYSNDDKTLSITIKEGVTFSDGTPVTSADVKFSIENAATGELVGASYQTITDIATPDDLTVELTYETASSGAVLTLASYAVAIIPEDFGGATAEEFWQNPVGVGAYTLQEWEQGVGMTLVRNDDYFGTPASVETIEFITVPDANTRLLQLQNGTADIIDSVTTAQADQISATEGFTVFDFAAGANIFLTLNSTKEPFATEELRRAASLGIDRASIVEAALQGLGAPGGSFVVPASVGGFSPAFGSLFDLDAAGDEMAAAGAADGFEFEIMYASGNPEMETALQVVQSSLAKAGITVTLAGLENDAIGAKVEANDWDAYVADIISEADAGEVLMYYGATNGFYAGDQDMMATIQAYYEQANAEFGGQDARNAIFEEALTAIAESALQIALYDPARMWAAADAVGELFPASTTGALDFTRLAVSK